MTFSIPTDIAQNHKRLSRASLDFLKYAAAEPGVSHPGKFPRIMAFSDGEGGNLQPWPTFINRDTRARISKAAVETVKLVKAVPKRIFNNDPSKIANYFKIPMERAEEALYGCNQGDLDSLLGRGDFILTASGFKCLEYNLASNLGGSMLPMARPLYRQNPVMQTFFNTFPVKPVFPEPTIFALLDHITRDCLERCSGCKETNTVNIVFFSGDAENRRKKKGHIEYIRSMFIRLLNRRYPGLKAELIFCPPSELPVRDNRVFYRNIPVHAIVNFKVLLSGSILESFAAGDLLLYNGNSMELAVQKLNIALLSEHAESPLFSPVEQQNIRDYIPWTRKIEAVRTGYKGCDIDLPGFIRSRKDKLVIKHSTGFGGQEVFVGFSTPQDEWDELVDNAIEANDWLVQEYCEPLSFIYQYGKNGGYGRYRAVWGFFVFGNHYIDGFLRVIPQDIDKGIINCKQGATVSILIEVDE